MIEALKPTILCKQLKRPAWKFTPDPKATFHPAKRVVPDKQAPCSNGGARSQQPGGREPHMQPHAAPYPYGIRPPRLGPPKCTLFLRSGMGQRPSFGVPPQVAFGTGQLVEVMRFGQPIGVVQATPFGWAGPPDLVAAISQMQGPPMPTHQPRPRLQQPRHSRIDQRIPVHTQPLKRKQALNPATNHAEAGKRQHSSGNMQTGASKWQAEDIALSSEGIEKSSEEELSGSMSGDEASSAETVYSEAEALAQLSLRDKQAIQDFPPYLAVITPTFWRQSFA